jgi:hypothetical protein
MTQIHNFTIYRGLTFAGLRLMCLDATGAPVAINAGTTALLQARKMPGKPLEFALPVTLGQAVGEILIPQISAASTTAFALGAFTYDLILISSDAKPWPPILTGLIDVKKSVSEV